MIIPARSEHLEAINQIYNQAVRDGLRTAHTHPYSIEERKNWLSDHPQNKYPVFVFTKQNTVVGWISVSPYRSDRQALNEVAEISYYVDYNYHRQGIGTQLVNRVLEFCQSVDFRIVVAILVSENTPSIALLEKFSFIEGGRIPDAIHYKDEFRDHLYMFKKLD